MAGKQPFGEPFGGWLAKLVRICWLPGQAVICFVSLMTSHEFSCMYLCMWFPIQQGNFGSMYKPEVKAGVSAVSQVPYYFQHFYLHLHVLLHNQNDHYKYTVVKTKNS